ncbi:hypothetical protein HMPREF3156_01248 [Neisseria sp. HMSC06F02]|nr:hypothetical protein HMPREF3156_01248 [Neisseria sp. HMSC06F02]
MITQVAFIFLKFTSKYPENSLLKWFHIETILVQKYFLLSEINLQHTTKRSSENQKTDFQTTFYAILF